MEWFAHVDQDWGLGSVGALQTCQKGRPCPKELLFLAGQCVYCVLLFLILQGHESVTANSTQPGSLAQTVDTYTFSSERPWFNPSCHLRQWPSH